MVAAWNEIGDDEVPNMGGHNRKYPFAKKGVYFRALIPTLLAQYNKLVKEGVQPIDRVSIPDPKLRAALEQALGGTSGAIITSVPLAGLTQLEAFGPSISDLSGLNYCLNLTELWLGSHLAADKRTGNKIGDISPIQHLSQLQVLDLSWNPITDFTPLSQLVQLRELALRGNAISQVEFISNLPNLETLTLMGAEMSDITALASNAKLRRLTLSDNQNLSDISALEGLTNLSFLDLSNNQISDISPLVNNKGLSGEVKLNHNPLNNMAYSTHLPALMARGLKVEYDEPAADMVTFKDANLERAIRQGLEMPTELLQRADLAQLRQLSVPDGGLTDLTGLEHSTSLTRLELGHNRLTDISAVANLTGLTALDLNNNQLRDIGPLVNLTGLTRLQLSGNQIGDITPLVENRGISGEIRLSRNPLTNTALTSDVPALKARGLTVESDELPADIIQMADSIFEASLRQAMDIPTAPITVANTAALVELELIKAGLINLDITALKALPALQRLNLTHNPLSVQAITVQIPVLESAGISVDLGTSSSAKVELSAAQAASLAASTEIRVTVRDAEGNKIKRETVDLTVDRGSIQTPAVNNGDGTYTATYTAVDTSGEVTITALTSNGKFGSVQIKLVEVAVSKDKSSLEIIGSNKTQTDEKASVQVTLVSEQGLPLSGCSVDLKVNPEEKVIINPAPKTDGEGQTTLVFAAGKPGLKIVTASAGGVELSASVAVIFSGAEVDLKPMGQAATLTMVTAKTALEADGESTTKLTITVLDKDGDALIDQQLELEVENGTLGEVVNNSDGTYSATYIAGSQAGPVEITAQAGNGKSATLTITLSEKVEQPKAAATFAVSTLKGEQSAAGGEFVSYLIKLEGKDGFADQVTLFATDPPSGVKIEFDPKEVTLSAAEALRTSQMTLTLDSTS